ncbi:MAG: zeta toxin family protein, partial [Methylophilaceae bacterium]
RITAMVAGGQASGKGSSVRILEKEIESRGINWLDFVRINTDSYKPLVLRPGSVDKFQYSQLTQTEASIIHQKLFSKLCLMAQNDKAPHVLVDQVFVGEDKLEYAKINSGQAIVAVVSTEVTTAIERAFQRGMGANPPELGRFEDTESILRCHKRVAEQLPHILAKFVGSNATARILDNNVIFGAAPDCAAMIFLGADDKRIVVLSKNAMKDFLRKLFINEKARGVAEVYPPGLSISDEDITKYFSTVKINVEYEPRTEVSASQHTSSSTIDRGPR